ncbi:MAG: hypothetical protein AAF460_10905, partial [Pseudomonadota bacterium]
MKLTRFGGFLVAIAALSSATAHSIELNGEDTNIPKAHEAALTCTPNAKDAVFKLDTVSIETGETLRQYLLDGDYTKLESELQIYYKRGVADRTKMDVFESALLFITSSDATFEPQLVTWHERNPNALIPRLALVSQYSSMAWAARGSRFSRELTDAQRFEFNLLASSAIEHAEKVLELDPQSRLAAMHLYGSLILVREREKADALRDRATRDFPDAHEVNRLIMAFPNPKWGGSYEAAAGKFAPYSCRSASSSGRPANPA